MGLTFTASDLDDAIASVLARRRIFWNYQLVFESDYKVNLGGFAASGSGFVISQNQVATNRHVLIDEATGTCVLPTAVCVITKEGTLQVAAIHLPSWGADDVAILSLLPQAPLTPLRLGFSELVEVGERIITIGFPAPDSSGFEEKLK